MKFLKTYGKRNTKLSNWISTQDRKHAFDSTPDSETGSSTHGPPKRTRMRNAAKKKAFLQLTSEDEENSLPHHKSPRRKKTTARLVPLRKRALLSVSLSSDEENVPSATNTKAANHKITRKKPRVCSDTNTDKAPGHCSDDQTCPPKPENRGTKALSNGARVKNSIQQGCKSPQTDSLVCLPPVGRFVTRRRCAISQTACPPILNSSDDFSSCQKVRPGRKNRPPVFLESSADCSVNAAALRSFITIPLRDISLNESAENSLGPCSRKPIFCSTPSAAPFTKRSELQSFNSTSSPPSISVSCLGPVSTFHMDPGSPEQFASQPHALPSEPSVGKQNEIGELPKHSQSQNEELCDGAFMPLSKSYEKSRSSETAHSLVKEDPTHNMPSIVTDEDISSAFTSATEELDWLNHVLKEKCLTQLCIVRLERLDDLFQLYSETTYSSCLGDLGSICNVSAKEKSLSADTSITSLHNVPSEPSTSSESAISPEIIDTADSSPVQHIQLVPDSKSTEFSKRKVFEKSENNSCSDHFSEKERSCFDPSVTWVQDGTPELSTELKNKCRSKECSVELEKLPQSIFEQYPTPELNCSNFRPKARISLQRSFTVVCPSPPVDTKCKAELTNQLTNKCLQSKPLIQIEKMSVRQIQSKLLGNLDFEKTERQSDRSLLRAGEAGKCTKPATVGSNEGTLSDQHTMKTSSKPKKKPQAPKEKTQRASLQRPGTTRKACVSGLSVSRWRKPDTFTCRTGPGAGWRTMDNSIDELIPGHHRQPVELVHFNRNFATPVKGGDLNVSSLLAELTPNTHTWSRLKAALSVHRKVLLTPKTPSSRLGLADLSQDLFATPCRMPLSKSFKSQLRTHESQILFEDDDLTDAEKVYAECGQQGPLPWEECLRPQRIKQCVKIGEGTFGEVFTTSGRSSKEKVALKVIPLEGSERVNGEEQKTFGEILHEIIISKELSCLKEKEGNKSCGFIGLIDLHCVKGCYPSTLLNAWDKFDKQKHSENDRPDFFGREQLFVIFEFEFGGTDLENWSGKLSSVIAAKSILQQVTAAMAVAEQELHFEHRDLHWGNVLVQTTKDKTTEFILNGKLLSMETKGVLVRIIDYSLSRLEIDELTVSCDISHDEELFMGQGDYQFQIYRLMRQENGNDWSGYNPHSNVLWLHYLCSKLLDMKYRAAGGKRYQDVRGKLTSFYDNVLQYSSATEVLQNSPLFQERCV